MSAMTFETVSAGIASKFLQTVVVIDDGAYYGNEPKPSEVNAPGRVAATDREQKDKESIGKRTDQNLNAKELVDAFANQGLVCAVLMPKDSEDAAREAEFRAAKNADILILDWKIGGSGDTTTKIIQEIVGTSAESNKRLRLVIIYTDQPMLESIIDQVEEAIESKCVRDRENGPYALKCGATRIAAFNKGESDNNYSVSEPDLPERVIFEFSKMTAGLVSNVVLNSLAAIRANTHRLLLEFGPELDPAYLTHRAMMTPADEAEDHLVPLIVDEIRAILDDAEVSNNADERCILSWLRAMVDDGLDLRSQLRAKGPRRAFDAALCLLQNGVNDESIPFGSNHFQQILAKLRNDSWPNHVDAINELTAILCNGEMSGDDCNRRLAELMSTRRRYMTPNPRLTLGTIIEEKHGRKSKFYVCIQPRCDSVRLPGKRAFLFLKMYESNSNRGFGYIVSSNGSAKELKLSLLPHESRLVEFTPSTIPGSIVATKTVNNWTFTSSGADTTTFQWVADLRFEQAQRVANEYAAHLSRVGLTESEWLRRSARKR